MKALTKYSFEFEPISNQRGLVRYFHPKEDKQVEVGFTINDTELGGYKATGEYSPAAADLLDLAAAIYASDRLTPQDLTKPQYDIHICLPVRNLEVMNRESFKAHLSDLLRWTTGRRWIFEFKCRLASGRDTERHPTLPFKAPENTEVALWSGGLDSLAGFYTRVKLSPEKNFILFGTGANSNIHKRQHDVFMALQHDIKSVAKLYRVPLTFSNSDSYQKNRTSRARGLVFMMLGSACSYLMGQKKLFIYENGIGAINLPYRSSSAGLDHSRATHPLTLLKASNLVSSLLSIDFEITNPFLFWTKAQMCEALSHDKQAELVSLTMSCDSPHRKKINQCGYCSSCLLRRQSLLAAQMEDKASYVILHSDRPPVVDPCIALRHMLRQVETLKELLSASDSRKPAWSSLAYQFPVLNDIVDRAGSREVNLTYSMRESLLHLYEKYVEEWDTVGLQVSVGLLTRNVRHSGSSGTLASAQQG